MLRREGHARVVESGKGAPEVLESMHMSWMVTHRGEGFRPWRMAILLRREPYARAETCLRRDKRYEPQWKAAISMVSTCMHACNSKHSLSRLKYVHMECWPRPSGLDCGDTH